MLVWDVSGFGGLGARGARGENFELRCDLGGFHWILGARGAREKAEGKRREKRSESGERAERERKRRESGEKAKRE